MNRCKIIGILVIILIFGEGTGLIFSRESQCFAAPLKDLFKRDIKKETGSKKVGEQEKADKKPDIEKQGIKELERKYADLLKQYEALKKDRDNVLIQAKRLLGEKRTTEELGEKNQQLEAEKEETLNQNQELQDEIKKLLDTQTQIEAERDTLREDCEKLKKGTMVKKLKKKISTLEKENKEITVDLTKNYDMLKKEFNKIKKTNENKLKRAQAEMEKLKGKSEKYQKKSEAKISELSEQLAAFKKNYAKAKKKNKALEKEVRNIPKKFSEIARQNKMLIKETSEMHYNLGVFYTNHKKYERAITEFKKTVEINPDDAHAHFNLGYIYAEYLVDREKAIEHFRHFLSLAKDGDKDIDWVRKYLLTWETFEGRSVMD